MAKASEKPATDADKKVAVDNLAIWKNVEVTDPKHTKQFNRGGGFKGTSTNSTYLVKKATNLFGPIGIGWGYEIVDEAFQPGQDKDVIHIVRIKFWYNWEGQRGEIYHFGQTQFVGKNKNGYYTDEEAPKKSLTDALSKCFSMLGFSADIFTGMYDDNRYVNDIRKKFADGADEFNGNPVKANDNSQASNDNRDDAQDIYLAIKKAIEESETYKDVAEYMTHKDTVKELTKILSKEQADELKKLAEDRMVALGWSGNGAAASGK